jgi:hypothetical protein
MDEGMTEAEMVKTWCPHARVAIALSPVGRDNVISGFVVMNRYEETGDVPRASMCLGSVCSQWRWAREKNPEYKPLSYMTPIKAVHPADEEQPWRPSKTRGYCGLAGRPFI